jgi:hypothetical protein
MDILVEVKEDYPWFFLSTYGLMLQFDCTQEYLHSVYGSRSKRVMYNFSSGDDIYERRVTLSGGISGYIEKSTCMKFNIIKNI